MRRTRCWAGGNNTVPTFRSKRSSGICNILTRFRAALFAEVAPGGHLRASDPGLEPMSLTLECEWGVQKWVNLLALICELCRGAADTTPPRRNVLCAAHCLDSKPLHFNLFLELKETPCSSVWCNIFTDFWRSVDAFCPKAPYPRCCTRLFPGHSAHRNLFSRGQIYLFTFSLILSTFQKRSKKLVWGLDCTARNRFHKSTLRWIGELSSV